MYLVFVFFIHSAFLIAHHLSSGFDIFSLSLQWFTSHLLSCTSVVAVQPHLSPSSSLTCGVLQGSVLGPILEISTPLISVLSSTLKLNHIYYMPMTQNFLYLSFSNTFCQLALIYSQLLLISSWMSSNYHTLNPSKT